MGATAGKSGGLFYRKAWIQETTIAFADTDPDTITDSGNGLVTAGFAADDLVTVSGTANNNTNYTIDTGGVAAGALTLIGGDTVTAEGAGALVTLQEALPGTQVLGFHNWAVDETLDDLEVTRFEDVGIEASIPGIRRWTATADRFFETTQLAPESWLGTELTVRFFYLYDAAPNVTTVWFREGKCRVSGISAGTGTQDVASESYTFTGVAQAAITATTIALVNSNPDTITDSGNAFITSGFEAGQKITISGSTADDGDYTIDTVAAGTITLISTDTLTGEVAGAAITVVSEVRLSTRTTAWPT